MSLFSVIFFLTALIALYAVVIRPWLRTKPWAEGFFKAIEPFETLFYGKSESILFARWNTFIGLLLQILQIAGGIDLNLLKPVIPEKYHPFLPMTPTLLMILGVVLEALRRDVSKPLSVVSMPEEKTAEQSAVVKNVEAANKLATAVANECPPDDILRAAVKSDAASSVAKSAVINTTQGPSA